MRLNKPQEGNTEARVLKYSPDPAIWAVVLGAVVSRGGSIEFYVTNRGSLGITIRHPKLTAADRTYVNESYEQSDYATALLDMIEEL